MKCHHSITFILQAKFYARININGTQQSKEETDRSSVSNGMRINQYKYRWLSQVLQPQILVMGIFYFSNVLVLTSTLLYFRKVFLWLQEQKKQILATIASAIAFVAILIHNFKGCNRKMYTFMICVTLNGLIICGLLLAISLLFIILVNNGLKSAGMGGLILSLVPPFAVFTIGLIINQKYFKSQKESPTAVTTTPVPGEPNQAMAIQTDDNEEYSEGTPLLQQVRACP